MDVAGIDTWGELSAATLVASMVLGAVWRWVIAPNLDRRIETGAQKAVRQFDTKLDGILAELKPNHGSSLKDQVTRIDERTKGLGDRVTRVEGQVDEILS